MHTVKVNFKESSKSDEAAGQLILLAMSCLTMNAFTELRSVHDVTLVHASSQLSLA